MTPREEFEYDLRRLCGAFMQHASLGLLTEIVNQVFKEVVDKWAPKDASENSEKNDTSKEYVGSGRKIEKPANVKRGEHSLVPYDDLVIIAAFRYCLGRRSYIVSHMTDYLKNHWRTIDQKTKKLIFREIEEAISNGCAGDDCDMESWKFILALRKDDD